MTGSRCPADALFEQWLSRDLSREVQRDVDHHVDECPACRARMIVLAQAEPVEEDGVGWDDAWSARVRLDPAGALSAARLLLARDAGRH